MAGKTTIVQNLRLVKKTCNTDFDDALSKKWNVRFNAEKLRENREKEAKMKNI